MSVRVPGDSFSPPTFACEFTVFFKFVKLRKTRKQAVKFVAFKGLTVKCAI